ncbi:MAG: sigma 54-interacting transcriptional regulator [Desulfitobacteriaceae bacterium]
MRKKVVLIAKEPQVARVLKQQLVRILGELVEIHVHQLNDLPTSPLPASDLIVVSSRSLFGQIEPFLTSPVLVCRRTINHNQITKVLQIPAGTRTLVVIDFYHDAKEFCSLLKTSGVDHIELIPWTPGYPLPSEITYALTFGKPFLIPHGIPNVVDIGIRHCDITTVVEIMQHLDLLDEQAIMVTAKYTNTLIKLYQNILYRAREADQAKELLDSIIEHNNDGILFVSAARQITIINPKAAELTGTTGNLPLDHNIDQTLPTLARLLVDGQGLTDEIIRFGDRDVLTGILPHTHEVMRGGWLIHLRAVTEIQNIEKELRKKLNASGHVAKYTFEQIVGHSAILDKVKELARKLARADGTILLTGESGVGKELFAHAVHNSSKRKNSPFVAANFSAFPESLLESELFGYEEGAFTGAKKGGKPGFFELAHGGTAFLDEIGDAPLPIQSRLLRILQEKEVTRIGDTKTRVVDIRIVAATNKDLLQLMKEGKFREDLYFRLAALPLKIPPLRERLEDIEALVMDLLWEVNQHRVQPLILNQEVMCRFYAHPWPGNIRELRNVIAYLDATVDNGRVKLEDLPETLSQNSSTSRPQKETDLNISNLVGAVHSYEYYLILRELATAGETGKGVGRRKIAKYLLAQHAPLSEQEVRSRLNELAEYGCVRIRAGAGGSKITPRGLAELQTLNHNLQA